MATRTAAAGGGNWTAGATWVGGVAPTAADDAVLDATSGNVTIDSGAVCRSLDCNNTNTGSLEITGANTFGTINKTAAAACTLTLPTSSGITITGLFNVTGASGAVLTLTGDITKAEGTVSCDYLNISSSDATGGAVFYAGANSTDGGSNTGWIFGAPTGNTPHTAGSHTVTGTANGALNVTPTVNGALETL